MLRRSALAGIIFLMTGALILSGCSSSSTDVNNNQGDPNSIAFQGIKSAIEIAVDSTLGIALDFAHKPDRYPNEGNVGYDRPELGPNDSLLYNYVDEWHVMYVGGTGAGNYNNVYVDSARYWEGTRATELFRWDRVTQIDLIRHQGTSFDGTGSEYEEVSAYVNLEFDNWNQADQMFAGAASIAVDRHYLDGFSPKNDIYEFDIEIQDVGYSDAINFSWTERDAVDGTLNITGTVTTDDAVENWTVTVEFNDGAADVAAQLGEVIYQYSMTPDYN
jgi:hypothetical protein